MFSIFSVIRTGSLKLVQETFDISPKFEYRAESNFFASMEISEYGKMDRIDDQDRDLERTSASSGELETLCLSWSLF